MNLQYNASMPASALIPTLPYADVISAARWLERVFDLRMRLQIGSHRIQMMTPEGGDLVLVQTDQAPAHAALMARVADVDAVYARVVAEGAKVSGAPQSFPYGERQFTALDCGGHAWTFSQSVVDVDPVHWGGVTGPGFTQT